MYFRIDESEDMLRQATMLQKRLTSRGNLAYFDPRSIEQSLASIEACEKLKKALLQRGSAVLTVATNQPFDLKSFFDRLAQIRPLTKEGEYL